MRNLFGFYYLTRKPKLLKSFDKTVALCKDEGISRYGLARWEQLSQEVRKEYEALIPQLPYVRHPMLRSFLIIAAQELAVYKVFKRWGKSPGEAWEVCDEALRKRLQRIPSWVRWMAEKYYFSNIASCRARKIAQESQWKPFGKWTFTYVEGDGKEFDFGVDYSGCSIQKFMKDQGAEEFAPYVCLSDIPLSEAMGWGLSRSETLADGCKRCNFRFKQGGQTNITSTIPEVQATIQKIREKEVGSCTG